VNCAGAVEEECVPVLERLSELAAGRDFTVGYSSGRINPGDRNHRFEARHEYDIDLIDLRRCCWRMP
jgi:UDP-N-acetyl-D-mannosaminuronate dehydrogenase